MNNFRKSLKELFQINHQAGILRLFLAAALTFVLWSLLAAISASLDPLGSLDWRNILGINSGNLALSLVFDIVNSYFSIFSFFLILLFLLVALFSFETITDFYTHLKSLPANKISRDYLTSCAFSFPKRKKLLFPDDLIGSGNILQGPLEAVIKPGYALLVKSREDYSVKFNTSDNSENFEVSLAFREKLIDCFNLKPSSISFSCREDQKLAKSFLFEVTYGYDIPADNENMVKFANMLALFDSGNIRKIIESVLISEAKIALSQYYRNSPEPSANPLNQVQEKPIDNKKNASRELEQKKYWMVQFFYKKVKDRGIKRNRKRPVYFMPSHEATALVANHEETFSPSLKDQLNELLAANLQNTLTYLFGTDCIKAKIINIHE